MRVGQLTCITSSTSPRMKLSLAAFTRFTLNSTSRHLWHHSRNSSTARHASSHCQACMHARHCPTAKLQQG